MIDIRFLVAASALLLSAGALAGCGGNSATQATSSTTTTAQADGSGNGSGVPGAGALTAEAQQTAAGDIPDNQVFLRFRNPAEGYSVKYPEGWAQRGKPSLVTFQDKNNVVRVEVAAGSAVSVSGVKAELRRLKQRSRSLTFGVPARVTVGGKHVVKVVYSTESAPNAVTGKRVKLVVDRYYVPGTSKHAVVDLGTPQGVDNVDAYRLMIESFHWK